MDKTQAIQYLQQLSSDFVQTLPVSARIAMAEKINHAFSLLIEKTTEKPAEKNQ